MEDEKKRNFEFKLFDEFPCSIWRSGVDAKCDYVNKAWLNFTGRTLEQELGEGWAEGIHPEDRDRCLRTYLEAFNSRQAFEMEYRLRVSTGEYRWINDAGRPFCDANGDFAGYIGACFDVTLRRRAEESAQEAQAHTESVLANVANFHHIVFDREWRYLYVNEAAVRAIGRPREEILGRTVWEIFPNIIGTELERQFQRAMNERVAVSFEFQYEAGDTWWEDHLSPTPEGLAVFANNITERKRAEESLKLFRSLLDRSSDAIEVIDPETLRFLDCNQSACQSLGYSREEFLTMSVFDIDPKVDESLAAAMSGEMKRSGFAMFESIHRRKDGSTFPVEVNVREIQLERAYRLAVVRDITERKQAEELIKQSESQLAEAQHTVHLGSWNWNIQANTLTWSDELYRIYGFQPHEFSPTYEAFLARVHPEDRDSVARAVAECLRSHEAFSFQERIVRPDGEVRVLQSHGNVVCDEQGNPARVFGSCQDVTERKRVEDELRSAKEFSETLIQTANVIILGLDTSGNVNIFNQAAEEITGYTLAELRGRSWFETLTPKDRFPHVWEEFNRLVAGGVPRLFENPILTKTGEERYILWQNNQIKVNGKIVATISFGNDITERIDTEMALRQAEQKYRDIFENAGEGIFQSTPDGRFIAANPALARMHGFDSPEELMRSRTDITREIYAEPERRGEFKDLLAAYDVVRGFEHQAFRKDGSKILVSVNARAVRDARRQILYYEGTARDITERSRAEARSKAFATLARKLSGAREQLDAGRIIAKTAADLFGWDSCYLDLYDPDRDLVFPMLNVDTIGGNQVDVTASALVRKLTARSKRVIDSGPELTLREEPIKFDEDAIPFGDKSRPSASLMKVSIRHASRVIGLLSIQSYAPRAYDDVALNDLQSLADHCGAALNRIRAEQALREAEQKFKNIFENASEGIFQSTPTGGYIVANPALARMFGFDSPEELIRERGDLARRRYVDPQRRQEFHRLLTEKGLLSDFEYEDYRKDGSRIWVSDNVRAVRDEHGEIQYYEGTTRDITERKQAEAALRESEERYRDLVENSRELICTHDLDGLILSANRTAAEVLGYAEDELRGKKNIRDILAPEVRHQFEDYMARIRREGATSGVMLMQTSTGERRIFEYYNSLRTEGVAAPVVRGMALDITDRRRAEKALRESEERYRELFDNSKDAIYVHDLKGFYTAVNRAGEKLSGYSRAEIIGKHFADFVPPEEMNRILANLSKKLEEAGETVYEVDMIARDGRRVPVEISSRVIYENGVAVAIQGTARDVTDRRRVEEGRARAHKLSRIFSRRLIEAQEAERQSIARELHDEIGQVLTAVRMNLQSVRHSCDVNAALPHVDESIVIVDEALGQVRELSLNLRPSLLDNLGLDAALRWYVDRYARRTAIVAEIVSDSENGERLPHELETACFRIAQEALTNVARHSQADHVSVQLERRAETLLLTIADNGVGFEVHNLLPTLASSLGLHGMEERARAVGGRVVIDSAPGRGTRVSASFPLPGKK